MWLFSEGRITCPLDEYLCSISYLQRALLTLERMSPRATLNKNSSSNLSCGFVTIIDAKPDFIRFRASQMNGDGVNATSMVHYKIYLCPVAMTLKIRIEFGMELYWKKKNIFQMRFFALKLLYLVSKRLSLVRIK